MFQHDCKIRVRYAETDQMGYVYYGNYAGYYEVGRVEALRSLGLSYRKMETDLNIMMPVLSMQMRFVRPGLYDDLLTIRTIIRKLPNQFINFNVEIYNEQAELLNGGSVKLGFIDATTRESTVAPAVLVNGLATYFES